jgi:hypothetical protein
MKLLTLEMMMVRTNSLISTFFDPFFAVPAQVEDPRITDPDLIQYSVKFETHLPEGTTRKVKKKIKPTTTFYLANNASWETFKATLLAHLSTKYDKDMEFTSDILESTFTIPRGITGHELLGDNTGGAYRRLLGFRKTGVTLDIKQTVRFLSSDVLFLNLKQKRGRKRQAEEDIDDRPQVRRRGEEQRENGDDDAGHGQGRGRGGQRGRRRGRGGGPGGNGRNGAGVDEGDSENDRRAGGGDELEEDIDEEEEVILFVSHRLFSFTNRLISVMQASPSIEPSLSASGGATLQRARLISAGSMETLSMCP